MSEIGGDRGRGDGSGGVEAIVRFGREHTVRELLAAIPSECLERSVSRELRSVAVSLASSAVAWVLLAVNPYWWLLAPLWFLAGTCVWGLMVIAHECGHGAFSASRRLNHWVGHLTMTPFLYPFHGWRLLHNHHHSNTNTSYFEWYVKTNDVTPAHVTAAISHYQHQGLDAIGDDWIDHWNRSGRRYTKLEPYLYLRNLLDRVVGQGVDLKALARRTTDTTVARTFA